MKNFTSSGGVGGFNSHYMSGDACQNNCPYILLYNNFIQKWIHVELSLVDLSDFDLILSCQISNNFLLIMNDFLHLHVSYVNPWHVYETEQDHKIVSQMKWRNISS